MIVKILLDSVHQWMSITANMSSSLVDQHIHIVWRVHLFQDLKVVFKVTNGLWLHVWLLSYLSLVRSESFPAYSVSTQVVPVLSHVSTSQVSKQCFTDWYIIRCSVVMELLMPLLVKVSRSLRDMVVVHYMENVISDPLSIACTFSNECETVPNEVSALEELELHFWCLVVERKFILFT